MHALRVRLEPGRAKRAPSSFIVTEAGGYAIDRSRVIVDADTFTECVEAGLAAVRDDDPSEATTWLVSGLDLYRGDFMVEERYAEWALDERDALRDAAREALCALRDIMLDAGDTERAAAYSRQLADLDPLDADAQRQLIELCVERGRRSEAARRYAAYRTRVAHQLGEQPEFELAEVVAGVPSAL
jgi:DNA-binding SARP family transcriptional activator